MNNLLAAVSVKTGKETASFLAEANDVVEFHGIKHHHHRMKTMKIFPFLTFLLMLLSEADAQVRPYSNYTSQTAQFINSTRKIKGYILLDEPIGYKPSCLDELKKDNLFTKKEMNFIEQSIKKPLLKKWTKQILPYQQIVARKELKAALKTKGTKVYHVHAAPIFLRNGTYCLFYNASYCGGQCASGRMRLYYKWGKEWIIVKSYCEWMS